MSSLTVISAVNWSTLDPLLTSDQTLSFRLSVAQWNIVRRKFWLATNTLVLKLKCGHWAFCCTLLSFSPIPSELHKRLSTLTLRSHVKFQTACIKLLGKLKNWETFLKSILFQLVVTCRSSLSRHNQWYHQSLVGETTSRSIEVQIPWRCQKFRLVFFGNKHELILLFYRTRPSLTSTLCLWLA